MTEIAAAGLITAELVRLAVLTTVEFDSQIRFGTVEVENVRPNGMLAAELEARELPRSKMGPEQALRVGLLVSKPATPSGR